MSYALVRIRAEQPQLDLASFAQSAQLHPDLVLRLVALGLLEPDRDHTGELWFPAGQLATVARIKRLRAGFGLNYAAIGLVIDLLDRIDELEQALRHAQRSPAAGPARRS